MSPSVSESTFVMRLAECCRIDCWGGPDLREYSFQAAVELQLYVRLVIYRIESSMLARLRWLFQIQQISLTDGGDDLRMEITRINRPQHASSSRFSWYYDFETCVNIFKIYDGLSSLLFRYFDFYRDRSWHQWHRFVSTQSESSDRRRSSSQEGEEMTYAHNWCESW